MPDETVAEQRPLLCGHHSASFRSIFSGVFCFVSPSAATAARRACPPQRRRDAKHLRERRGRFAPDAIQLLKSSIVADFTVTLNELAEQAWIFSPLFRRTGCFDGLLQPRPGTVRSPPPNDIV